MGLSHMAFSEQMSVRTMADTAMEILRGASEAGRHQRRALLAFSIRLVSAAIAYFSQALLARWMGTFEYGVFAYVWIWIIILGSMSNLGLNGSVQRFIPQYRENGDLDLARGFIRSAQLLSLAVASALALTGAGLLYLIQDVISSYYVLPLFLAAICLPMFTLTDTQDGMSRAFSWIDLALIPPYIMRPVLLLVVLAGAVAFGAPANAVTAVAAAIAAVWISACVQNIVMRRRIRNAIAPGPIATKIGRWLSVSIPFMLMDGFYLLLGHADVLVLDLFRSPRDIAVYYAALKTTSLIAFVYFAVVAVVAPRFSELDAVGDRAGLSGLLRASANWIFWPSLIAAVCILAIGWPLLWLFGPDFTRGYPVMFVLVIGMLVRAAMGPVDSLLNMLGEQKICMAVLGVATLANIALNFALIPAYGLYGAAAATSLSAGGAAFALFLFARSRLGLHTAVLGRAGAQPSG